MGQTCYPERHEHESNMLTRRRLSSIDSASSSDSCISIPKEDGYMPQISAKEWKMMYKSWSNAIEMAQVERVQQLLDRNWIFNFLDYHWDDGSSALQIACKEKNDTHWKLASLLLAQHADVNEQNAQTLDTALHIAVRNQNAQLVELLLGWEADKHIKNKKGETPISMATSRRIHFILTGSWFPLPGEHIKNLIPRSLQNELKNECSALIADRNKMNYRSFNFPKKNCNVQIQDLIEPCKPSFDQLQFEFSSNADVPNPVIPAIFRLNEDTNLYEIKSDINDLPKKEYSNLYSVIERIFNRMVGYIRDKMESNEYYVTVKMTDFQFIDEYDSVYGDDDFHFEGFETEYIKEVALYYFDISDNINGGGIVFKDDGTWRKNMQRIEVKDNDCVFFTNEHPLRHKTDEMRVCWLMDENLEDDDVDAELYTNNNGAKVYGTHKVLAFYIADTTNHDKIRTSKDVVVNFEFKIDQIVDYWMREVELMSNVDVSMIIIKFMHDATLIKMKTNKNRRRRLSEEHCLSPFLQRENTVDIYPNDSPLYTDDNVLVHSLLDTWT